MLYNYIAFQGNQPLTGRWITFKELPNSASKVKTLTRLEKKLAAAFAGRQADLRRRGQVFNGEAPTEAPQADVALVFRPLPRIPLMLLFWDAEAGEGFEATARFLFDSQVSAYLDLESLLFLVEKLLERLLDLGGSCHTNSPLNVIFFVGANLVFALNWWANTRFAPTF